MHFVISTIDALKNFGITVNSGYLELQYLKIPSVIKEYSLDTFPMFTVKILKIGTPEIITIIVLQLEQLDFTVQYCVQKMQTE